MGPQFRTVLELSQFVNEVDLLYETAALRLVRQASEGINHESAPYRSQLGGYGMDQA
ncbi:MAG: hypothetical protein MZV64_62960 [Ignavibacteriales bacterium]|nr:hypothetical protein [Ignavibacteriales bacterium]